MSEKKDYKMRFKTPKNKIIDWKRISTVAFIILGIGIPLSLIGGFYWGNSTSNAISSFTPVIDGVIESGWERADYKISTYSDINETKGNKDALNYLYIEETEETFDFAIDMVSKQNSSTEGEWTGLWLNTLNQSFGFNESIIWSILFGFFDLPYYLDNGIECLIYDIENDSVYTLIKDESTIASQNNDILTSYTDITSGILRTDGWVNPNVWSDTYNNDGHSTVITSEQESINADVKDHILINFSIPIQDFFYMIPESSIPEMVASMSNIHLDLESFLVKQSYSNINDWSYIDEDDMEMCNLYIENNGSINDAQLQMDVFSTNTYYINNSALEDGYLNFSIQCYNHTLNPYLIDLWIDYFQLSFNYESAFDTLYGVSTIENFEFEYDFTTSVNSDLEHRTIEISIPKTEIEYEEQGFLNVFVEGDGFDINQNDYTYPRQFDELINNARNLIRSYAFTAGTQSYGDDDGTKYQIYWSPLTPAWSRNYFHILF